MSKRVEIAESLGLLVSDDEAVADTVFDDIGLPDSCVDALRETGAEGDDDND